MALLFVPASFILDIHRGSWGNAALFETCRCFDVSLFPPTASFLFHKMSEKLSIPSILSTSSSTIHPPFKLSRHMAIIFPSLLTVLLPWTLLDYVEHLSVLTPGREFWISLPGRTQTTLKPLPVLVW